MDATGRPLLRALHRNARPTGAGPAEEVGLSPSPCWTRVRRPEQAGAVRGCAAVLDQAAPALPDAVAIGATTETHDGETPRRFGQAAAAADTPGVIEARPGTGECDDATEVAVGGTAGDERLPREAVHRPPGTRHTRTRLTLRRPKQSWTPAP